MIKQFYFKQFSFTLVCSLNVKSSLSPIHRSLSGATNPGQSGHGSDVSEEFCVPKSSIITEASLSYCLVSYPGHLLGKVLHPEEMQSVYFTVPADWTISKVPVLVSKWTQAMSKFEFFPMSSTERVGWLVGFMAYQPL